MRVDVAERQSEAARKDRCVAPGRMKAEEMSRLGEEEEEQGEAA